MRGAARVHRDAGVRQLLEQRAGAAGVVEVDVGEQHPVDRGARDALGVERREQVRHRERGAGIDERRAAAVDDQVAGVEPRAHIVRVDRRDAVGVIGEVRDDEAGSRRPRIAPGARAHFAPGLCGGNGTHSDGDCCEKYSASAWMSSSLSGAAMPFITGFWRTPLR